MLHPLRYERFPADCREEYYAQRMSGADSNNRNRRRSIGKTQLSEEKRIIKASQTPKATGQIKLSEMMAMRCHPPLPPSASPRVEQARMPSFGRKISQQETFASSSQKARFKTEVDLQPPIQPKVNNERQTLSPAKRTLIDRAIQTYQAEVQQQTCRLANNPHTKHEQIQRIVARQAHYRTEAGNEVQIQQPPSVHMFADDEFGSPRVVSFVTMPFEQQQFNKVPAIPNQMIRLTDSQSFEEEIQPVPVTKQSLPTRPLPEELIASTNTSRYGLRMVSSVGSRRSSEGSISVQSRISSIKNKRMEESGSGGSFILEKMEVHLDILNCFRDNAEWVEEYYSGDAQWDLVKFYSYNRYYIERERVVGSLLRGNESCFTLKDLQISKTELKQVYRSPEITSLAKQVVHDNVEVRRRLEQYFEALPLKPYGSIGPQHVNSRQMIRECDLELQGLMGLLRVRVTPHQRDIYQQRIISIMQIVFLIQELDGDFVKSFADSIDVLDFGKYIEESWPLYEQILAIRC